MPRPLPPWVPCSWQLSTYGHTKSPPPSISVLTTSVATKIGSFVGVSSSQYIFDQIYRLLHAWNGPPPQVRWCPGHADIEGNDVADSIAKEAATRPPPRSTRRLYSLASARRYIRTGKWSAAQAAWEQNCHGPYLAYDLPADRVPRELRLPRYSLGKLLAIRSHHGDFAAYHQRFNHENATLTCRCGSQKSPLHFWHCRLPGRRLSRPFGPASRALPFVLGTLAGAKAFSRWLTETRFYIEHCPPHQRLPPVPPDPG